MWAYCRFDLRLSDDEYNSYSLHQINALTERHKEQKKESEYLSAMICSVIANVNSSKGKSYKPSDFMRKEKKKQTVEEMLLIFQALAK